VLRDPGLSLRCSVRFATSEELVTRQALLFVAVPSAWLFYAPPSWTLRSCLSRLR
jgi:hypothetical protein